MNPTMDLANNPLEIRAGTFTQWSATERIILILTSLAMIASLIAFLSYEDALSSQLKPDELYSSKIIKSQLYYVAYAVQIALSISAGVLALITTDWRNIERGYLLRFTLFMGAAVLMTARGYSIADLLSTKLVDVRGPFPYLISVMVFIGARRKNWVVLDKALALLAVVFCALTVLKLAGLQRFSRQEGVAQLAGFLNALYWPAVWIALKDYRPQAFSRRLRLVPLSLYGVASLFTLTRLNFIMLLAALGAYSFLQTRRKVPQGASWAAGLMLAIWVGLFAAVFLRDTGAFERTENAVAALSERLDEDTRTGQIVNFFDNVEPRELLLGRGALATWNWPGMGAEWESTDVGYLSLLLFGGVPLLVTYILVHLKPAFSVLRWNVAGPQPAAACVLLLWGLRMFSSTYPGMSLEYYVVLFCVGACIANPFSERLDQPVQIGTRRAVFPR